MKMPKIVYLKTIADFKTWEEVLKPFAEKYLSPDWEWSFKVGGKVMKDIEKVDGENEGIMIIKKYLKEGLVYAHGEEEEENKKVKKEEKLVFHMPEEPFRPMRDISKGVRDVMGKHSWQVDKMEFETDKFFLINRNVFEEAKLLQFRKELWDWMVQCVEGEKKTLFCAHIVRECDKWDVYQLFNQVKTFLHTENYREFGGRIEKLFLAQPENKEDIFSFISRVEKLEEEVMHLEHLAQEAGETLKMPVFYKVWKILGAVERFPEYRIYTEKVQAMAPNDWNRLTPQEIRGELHKLHANKVQLQAAAPVVNQVSSVASVQKSPSPPRSLKSQGFLQALGRAVIARSFVPCFITGPV